MQVMVSRADDFSGIVLTGHGPVAFEVEFQAYFLEGLGEQDVDGAGLQWLVGVEVEAHDGISSGYGVGVMYDLVQVRGRLESGIEFLAVYSRKLLVSLVAIGGKWLDLIRSGDKW